jgi:hypothetical protein
MSARALAKARRRDAEARAERTREVRRLTVADQARDIRDRDRGLLIQERRCRREALCAQILLKRPRAELRIRPLDLARRAAERAREDRERQAAAVVPRDELAREHVQPAPALGRTRTHAPFSDAFLRA